MRENFTYNLDIWSNRVINQASCSLKIPLGWKTVWRFLKKLRIELPYDPSGVSQVVLVVKNLPANAGDLRDASSVPGLGRSPGEGHGNPLQNSCLENPMDRGGWQVTVHRVATSWTQLKQLSRHTLSFNGFGRWSPEVLSGFLRVPCELGTGPGLEFQPLWVLCSLPSPAVCWATWNHVNSQCPFPRWGNVDAHLLSMSSPRSSA